MTARFSSPTLISPATVIFSPFDLMKYFARCTHRIVGDQLISLGLYYYSYDRPHFMNNSFARPEKSKVLVNLSPFPVADALTSATVLVFQSSLMLIN